MIVCLTVGLRLQLLRTPHTDDACNVDYMCGATLAQTHTHKDLVNIMVRTNELEIIFTTSLWVWVWVSVAPLITMVPNQPTLAEYPKEPPARVMFKGLVLGRSMLDVCSLTRLLS